jgi:hypothetical protein
MEKPAKQKNKNGKVKYRVRMQMGRPGIRRFTV